jgi:predicted house-cleaning NTP pyrophosphatase (Maf/HAM1 superfamily)
MLEPLRSVLASHRVILASGSPRRHEILSKALPSIEIIPSKAEENLDRNDAKYKQSPWKYAEDTALLKAQA